MVYSCPRCGYSTELKQNMKQHIFNKKNICIPTISNIDLKEFKKEFKIKKEQVFNCNQCDKQFNRKFNYERHMQSCKNELSELTELTEFIEKIDERYEKIESENRELKNIILELAKNQTQNQIVHNTHNTINNINIVLPYDKSDISHLSDKDMLYCLNRRLMSIKHLIEKIHFDPNKPENHNICIKNKKDKTIEIFNGKYWQIWNNKEEILNNIISDKEDILENWAYENIDKYPIVDKKIKEYNETKEKEGSVDSLKSDINNMFLKNRGMVLETHKNN